MTIQKVLIISFLAFYFFNAALAQNEIRGNVQGENDVVLTEIEITVKEHQKNRVEFKVKPDATGNFMLKDIPDGTYDITCVAAGCVSQKLAELPLANNLTKLLFFRLRQGDPKEVDIIMTYASLQTQLQRAVTTASLKADAQSKAPATVYVVTAQDIENRGYTTLAEVLEDIPEIEIQDRSNYYSYNMISIRGVKGNNKFLVLMDGVRISSFATLDMAWDKNISIRYAEQIEVLLGPAAALYGSDALTGVINIITQKPTQNTAQASLSYGSFQTADNSLALSFKKNDFSIFATGSAYLSKEAMMPSYYQEEYDWYWNYYQKNGAMPVLGDTSNLVYMPIKDYQAPRFAYWVNTKLQYKNWELGFQRNSLKHNLSISAPLSIGLAWNESATTRSTTNAYLTNLAQGKKWSLKSLLNWNWYEINPKSSYADGYNGYVEVYQYSFNHTLQINELFSYEITDKHQIQAGINASGTYLLPTGSRSLSTKWELGKGAANLENQYYLGTQTTWINGQDTQIRQNINYAYQVNAGAFVQYQGNVADKLFITAGGRFDYYTVRERSYPIFNPRVGLVYQPNKNWTLKGFYGESFLTPSPEVLYADYTSIYPVLDSTTGLAVGYEGDYAFIPNANLKPEKMRSGEMGLLFAKNNWLASINGYANALGNIISTQAFLDSSYLGIPIAYVDQNVNGASLFSYGGTARLGYRLPFGKEKEGTFELSLAYSFADGINTDLDGISTRGLSYTAMHSLKASLLFRYKGFYLNLRAIYRSRTYDGGIYDANGEFVQRYNDPFVLLNLHAYYRLLEPEGKRPGLNIFIKIRNLTDARYYNAAMNYNDTFFASPQDPMRIMGGLSFSFGK